MTATGGAPEIARVGRAMRSEYAVLLDDIAGRVWRTVPAYSQFMLDPAELEARIGESVSLLIDCLIEDRAPTSAELDRVARVGERRALQGFSSTALIQSFRTSERVLGDEFQGWCHRMQVRPAIARAARATLVADLDLLERTMLEAYEEIRRQIEHDDRLSEPSLFRRLVDGVPIEAAEAASLAAAIGVVDPQHTPFLAAAVRADVDRTGLDQVRHRLVTALTRRLGSTALSSTVEVASGQVVLLAVPWAGEADELVAPLTAAVDELGDGGVLTAIGIRAAGLSSLGASCLQAVRALETMRSDGANRCIVYSDVLLDVLVRSAPLVAQQLAEHDLGPIANSNLLETLRAYVDHDLSPAASARAMGVHKNTILYRIRRVEELTGLVLHRPRDLARAVVALEALRANGDGQRSPAALAAATRPRTSSSGDADPSSMTTSESTPAS